MSIDSIRKVSLRQAAQLLPDVLEAGLVANLVGSPGIGKSALVHSVAKLANLELIDYRASTGIPVDMQGLPFRTGNHAEFLPFSHIFPTVGTPVPEGRNGWLLFLDEMNSASKAMQTALYKLILDKWVGQHKLHPQVHIVCAGNRESDKAIVTKLSTAMQSRLIHFDIEVNAKEWIEDVGIAYKYDHRILAYISAYPEKLNDFNPDHSYHTFCCPRTWQFMSQLLEQEPSKTALPVKKLPLYAGTITPGIAADFVQFTAVYTSLVTMAQVIKDPLGSPVPTDNAAKWATVTSLAQNCGTNVDIAKLNEYIKRFPLPFQLLFWRMVIQYFPQNRSRPEWAAAMIEIQKYLHG